MTLDGNWFTEIDEDNHAAFSFRIRGKLHEEQTPYQHLVIYDTEGFGPLMVLDGYVMLTARDNFIYHEMMSHPALFTHPAPKRVLVVGGGDCGTLKEVLKHDEVTRAVQVELDERVTRVTEQFFPELTDANDDPRAELVFDDGIQYVEQAEPGSFDVIIVDSTDPVGPAAGLFATEFYAACHRALGRDGILAVQSESPLFQTGLLRRIHDNMRSAGYLDVMSLNFQQPTYPSGWWTATLACKDNAMTEIREEDAAAKPFPTRYYNLAVHRAAMAYPEFMRELLHGD